jgi:hypothetical protein
MVRVLTERKRIMENTEQNPPEIIDTAEAWKEHAEAMERNQPPLPSYFKCAGKAEHKTHMLFVRVQPRLMAQYEVACHERGLNPSEATRQLITGWLRNPESQPMGLPVSGQ